jgi:hypothetical protein
MGRFLFDVRENLFEDITPIKAMLAPWKGFDLYLYLHDTTPNFPSLAPL